MAKIEYADLGSDVANPLVKRIAGERGSVLHLYRMLLHSPPVAEGWLSLLTAIRQQCELADDIRELVIMRIAALNNAAYEADQHAPIALAAGLSAEQLDALRTDDPTPWFDEQQSAVIALTDAMTKDIHVADDVMDRIAKFFDERGTVELVTTVAAYNMVSRFIVALDIQSNDDVGQH